MLNSFFKKVLLKNYTTSKIGGIVNYFCLPKNIEELLEAIIYIKVDNLPYYILGGGSNTIFDENLDSRAVVICLRDYCGINKLENKQYKVKAGSSLQSVVDYAKDHQLSGLTGLNRVPGTLGGAVLGNAGAYGCEIKDVIQSVVCLDLLTLEFLTFDNGQSKFSYRDSAYKSNLNLLIIDITIALKYRENYKEELIEYERIAGIRDLVYPVGFCSPGSVFKNLLVKGLSVEALAQVPKEFIMYDKVSVGKLLESVGAKGRRYGDVMMRSSHANIMEIVSSQAKYTDVISLLKSLKEDVYKEYGIELVEEIRLVKSFRNLI